jgi:hypothetical protein
VNQLIKKIALEAMNASSPLRFMEATVVSAPPDLKIELRDNDKLIIPTDLIIVSEYLSKHTRQIRVNGGTPQTYEFMDELKSGDRVMVAAIQGGQSFFILDRFVSYE